VLTDATTSSYRSVFCETQLHWTPPFILIVYRRLSRQRPTNSDGNVAVEKAASVLHIVLTAPAFVGMRLA